MKELLKKLVQAESTNNKGELAAAEVLSAEFKRFGLDTHIDRWNQTRANIVAHVTSTGQKPALLFVCHLDVVGPGEGNWQHPPFAAEQTNGRIYGRGTADMKGGITAAVKAITNITDSDAGLRGDIIFLAAAGEETDSCGIEKFVRGFDRPDPLAGVVIPEPTDFDIVTAHRGMLWLRITATGKAAHSSTPQLGVNAISSMRRILDELENYKIPWKPHELLGPCSMSINTISGGKALNVVPDKCTIGIDIRTLPDQDSQQILDDIEQTFSILRKADPQFDAEVSVIREVRAMETDCNCDFVKGFCSAVGINKTKAVGFTTDGPHVAHLGPIVIFGPGKPELCHKPDEYIDLSDIEKAVSHYENIIRKFLT